LIKSMTAYGRGEWEGEGGLFTAEIKSVNNRYRDIILRIPKNIQPLEDELRSWVSSKVRRGRIEVSLQIRHNGSDSSYRLDLNVPLAEAYFKIFDQVARQFGLDRDIRLESLCQLKDVILVKAEEIDLDRVRTGFHEALEAALDSLDQMRLREGEAIKADFLRRLDLLGTYLKDIKDRVPHVVQAYGKRLRENLNRMLAEVEVDEARVAQEVAILADRSDVTEEIVRLRSHLSQFRVYVSQDEALGRRLDFLLQEMNREVNTLSSKASDATISRIVVEMKAELEKLREQVQNVE